MRRRALDHRFLLVTGLVLVALAVSVESVRAQAASGAALSNPLEGACGDLRECVQNVVQYSLGLAGVLALAGIVWGGFLYLTAGDNQDRIESAKRAVTYSIIGLIVIGFAYAIVTFIFQAFSGGGGPGGVFERGGPSDVFGR